MEIDDQRAARSTRTRRRRSARASSSRATSSSTCSRARPARRSSHDGDTMKVTQTATPVQLDEVLTSLQSDTRAGPQDVLSGIGDGAERQADRRRRTRSADPAARGETAAESLNDAYDDIGPAERSTAQVNEALLGTRAAARPRAAARAARRTPPAGLVRNEVQLKDLITNFNTTMGAFAGEQDEPARLDPRARPDAAAAPTARSRRSTRRFPPTRAFAREILPGVRETRRRRSRPAFPWIDAGARAARAGRAAAAWPRTSRPATRPRAADRRRRSRCSRRPTAPARCARDVVLPTGDVVDPGRVRHRQRELQGVLLRAGRPRRRGPELRRQRQYVRFQTGGGDNAVAARRSTTGGAARSSGAPPGTAARHAPARHPGYSDRRPSTARRGDAPPTAARRTVNGPAARQRAGAPAPAGRRRGRRRR